MSRVLIPKDTILKRFIEPKPAWIRDEDGLVWIRCQCGHLFSLQHEILPNGDVNPSLWHDQEFCGWHVFGTLQGWDNSEIESYI